jgi:hypothetical protein
MTCFFPVHLLFIMAFACSIPAPLAVTVGSLASPRGLRSESLARYLQESVRDLSFPALTDERRFRKGSKKIGKPPKTAIGQPWIYA